VAIYVCTAIVAVCMITLFPLCTESLFLLRTLVESSFCYQQFKSHGSSLYSRHQSQAHSQTFRKTGFVLDTRRAVVGQGCGEEAANQKPEFVLRNMPSTVLDLLLSDLGTCFMFSSRFQQNLKKARLIFTAA